MPIDYENMMQYATPLRCPDCGERTFQTDAEPTEAFAFVDAECTNCGHALTAAEIAAQVLALPPGSFPIS